ncbi:hypothetical protein SAMN05444380_101123 [Thermophagus xiamenensis]|jgi:hypothetical protein|uniref:Sporulation related domain-containing protein n=2 Tax=Thermophagus xiamenensis TaxID=385682 RepID=A0A1I1ULC3_9BACT|nr:hypothetical protein SAMN05444380_101123 [Thermophagus xiamenensis]
MQMTDHEQAFIRWKEDTRREALEKELTRLKKEITLKKHLQRKIITLLIIVSTLLIFSLAYIFFHQLFSNPISREVSNEIISAKESQLQREIASDSVAKIKQLIILPSTTDTLRFKLPDDGIIFSVQVGAYINTDMSKFKQNMISLRQIDYGGINQFTLGIFTTYEEALEFRDIVRKLGFKEAYITAIQNGQRINIREALQQRGIQ